MADLYIPLTPIEAEPVGAIRVPHGTSLSAANRAALLDALGGLELGEYDADILTWLVGWEPSTVATICSWLHRVRAQATGVDRLATLTTSSGTWAVMETHTRPGGDVDVIASHTAPGGRPVLLGFRLARDGWHQLAGEWTDLATARTGVERATRTQTAGEPELLFLDLAFAGRAAR